MFGTSLAIYGFNNLSEIKEKIKKSKMANRIYALIVVSRKKF